MISTKKPNQKGIQVQERVITPKELARALASILAFKRPAENKKESIEAKVTDKAVAESQLHIIESSDMWQQHKKTHANAHLTIIEPTEVRNPESIRQMLGKEIVPYAPSPVVTAAYKETLSPVHTYGGPHTTAGGEYVGPGHPSQPGFMAGCDCGMVLKVEPNKQDQQLQVTSYGIVGAKPSGIAYETRVATDVYAQSSSQQTAYSSSKTSEYQ